MRLNESLNLVVPLRVDEKGPQAYAYHTPISREVFEANYRIISATKAALFTKGLAYAADAGPQIAALRLLDEGRQDALERGDLDEDGNPNDGGAEALLAEIKRLTMVLAPTPQGWEPVPVDAAITQGVIDAEDWREAESAIVFFTCPYAMANRANRVNIAQATAGVLGGSITSSSLTEYSASFPTLTPAESTPKAGSSVPS